MEKLLILSADGRKVLERELAAEKGPLLVVASATGGVSLAASAAAGDDVLGALVRGEDGWSLATAKAGSDVVSGPKRASELPLLVGQQATLGGYVFKIEGETSQSGSVLVWRLGRSPVAADAVLAGRNVVTYDEATGVAAVNPAMQDDVLIEFYPGVHGVEVVSRAGDHLTVAPGEAFEVGDFRAIVLPYADAREAMKARNPFAWPSRRARRLLVAAVATILGVLLFAGVVNQSASALARLAASRSQAAQRFEARAHLSEEALDDDRYLFLFTFYRDLPLMLQAQEGLATHDLIKRADDMGDVADVQTIKAMLEAVLKCQRGILVNRWQEIDEVLKTVPRRIFEHYGADGFYDDVAEVNKLVHVSLPDIVIRKTEYGHEGDIVSLYSEIEAALDDLKDNRFRDMKTLKAFVSETQTNLEILRGYIQARDALLGTEKKPAVETAESLADVTRAFASLGSVMDGVEGMEGYVPLVRRERALLCGRLAKWAARADLLGAVVDLAEVLDADAAQLDAWRKLAATQKRTAAERVRKLYREYRLKGRGDAKRAREILDEILAASDADRKNPFRVWAEREKGKMDKKEASK